MLITSEQISTTLQSAEVMFPEQLPGPLSVLRLSSVCSQITLSSMTSPGAAGTFTCMGDFREARTDAHSPYSIPLSGTYEARETPVWEGEGLQQSLWEGPS